MGPTIREVPLLAGSSYPRHHKLRPLNGCFRVDSGTSPLAIADSRFRPKAAIGETPKTTKTGP